MIAHISYKTAKALKEFLGESAPEPMDKHASVWYKTGDKEKVYARITFKNEPNPCPAYQLHDLLSKPFCEAMAKKLKGGYMAQTWGQTLFDAYYCGGMEAVEKALVEMMEAK